MASENRTSHITCTGALEQYQGMAMTSLEQMFAQRWQNLPEWKINYRWLFFFFKARPPTKINDCF